MCLTITLFFAKEVPYRGNQNLPTKANGEVETEPSGPLAVLKGFKNLPTGMPSVLLVTGLTWVCHLPYRSVHWLSGHGSSLLTADAAAMHCVVHAALLVPVHPLRHRLDGP
jgi:hypothetical protein